MQSQQRSIEETAIAHYVAPQNVEQAVTLWRLAVSAGQTGVNVYRELQNAGITWFEARQVYREITNELSRHNINWNDYAQRITTRLVNEAERVQPNDRYSTIMGTLGAAAGALTGTMGGLPGIVAGGIAGHQAGTRWGNAVPNGAFRQFINGESPLPNIGVETMPTNQQIGQTPLTSEATPVKEIGIGGKAHNPKTPMSDKSSEPTPAPEPEAATALRAGGGGPGTQVSKETPISSYPSISYGLQETHTTVLPYVTWCTLAIDKNATAPIQLKVRVNSIYDMLDIAIVNPPADDTIFSGPGFTNKKVGFNGRSPISGNGYPVVPSTGTSATERPQWRDYWAQIYQYYTVLGCEYEIIHVNPIGNHDTINGTPGNRVYGGDIICAEQIDTYSDTAAATGNVMPLTTLHEVMNYKNIKWHKIEANSGANNFGNTLIVKGRYTPGQEKRNIVNDGDVKTWTAVGSQPNLKEFLTLNYWPHPLSAGTAFGANMQIRLKYIVQFKDLVAQARYPNSLNTTGNVQQDIRNADLAAQTLSDTVRQKTG